MAIRVAVFILLSLLIASSALAQQQSCRVDLPVGMVGADGSLLNGLTAKDITVRLRKQTLPIETIGYDTGPRRVLFILDTSRRLPPEARQAETMLVNYVLANARPGDSFALLTARGAARQVRFGEIRDALVNALRELAADPKEQTKAPNVLDSIMAGIGWFGEPRIGDAILIMADHLEELNDRTQYESRQQAHSGPLQGVYIERGVSYEAPSRFKFSAVADSLFSHRIRVFGLQFGAMRNVPMTSVYSPNDENLFGISQGSGGYAVLDPADAFGAYVINDARTRNLQHKVFQLYGAIAQFYTLSVSVPASLQRETWKLELAKDLQSNTVALYARRFDLCQTENLDATVK
jgi:hypothetical protein